MKPPIARCECISFAGNTLISGNSLQSFKSFRFSCGAWFLSQLSRWLFGWFCWGPECIKLWKIAERTCQAYHFDEPGYHLLWKPRLSPDKIITQKLCWLDRQNWHPWLILLFHFCAYIYCWLARPFKYLHTLYNITTHVYRIATVASQLQWSSPLFYEQLFPPFLKRLKQSLP